MTPSKKKQLEKLYADENLSIRVLRDEADDMREAGLRPGAHPNVTPEDLREIRSTIWYAEACQHPMIPFWWATEGDDMIAFVKAGTSLLVDRLNSGLSEKFLRARLLPLMVLDRTSTERVFRVWQQGGGNFLDASELVERIENDRTRDWASDMKSAISEQATSSDAGYASNVLYDIGRLIPRETPTLARAASILRAARTMADSWGIAPLESPWAGLD